MKPGATVPGFPFFSRLVPIPERIRVQMILETGTPSGASWNHMLDFMQWPAMVATVWSAWLVGSEDERRRKIGFYVFLVSNVLWVVWGVGAGASAIVVLQVCLAILNIRGVYKNKEDAE